MGTLTISTTPARTGAVGMAIIDPGATASVVGASVPAAFITAMSEVDLPCVSRAPSHSSLTFGAGAPVPVNESLVLPDHLCSRRILVRALFVPGELPLLLSRPSLTLLQAAVEFSPHFLCTADEEIVLTLSSVAQYHFKALGRLGPSASPACALLAQAVLVSFPVAAGVSPVSSAASENPDSEMETSVYEEDESPADVLVECPTSPARLVRARAHATREPGATAAAVPLSHSPSIPLLCTDMPSLADTCRKLHSQYSHESADQLYQMLCKEGSGDPVACAAIRTAVAAYLTSHFQIQRPAHALVALPTANLFNGAVAADLFFISGIGPVLDMIALFSLFYKCCALLYKTAPVVGDAFVFADDV